MNLVLPWDNCDFIEAAIKMAGPYKLGIEREVGDISTLECFWRMCTCCDWL